MNAQNIERFKEEVQRLVWDDTVTSVNVNEAYDTFELN